MRQSTKRSLRELIAQLVERRDRLRHRGRWAVKPALAAPEFKDAGTEVYIPSSGQSVMTLMHNDVSQFVQEDIDYLTQLHNAVPEISAYTALLEAQVLRMRGLLIQCRSTMEEAIETPGGDEPTPIPPAILDRLDAMLAETGRIDIVHDIRDPQDPLPPRRRAIRMSQAGVP